MNLRPYAQLVRLPNLPTALADITLAALATGTLVSKWPAFLLLLLSSACLYSAGHPVLHLNDISGTDRRQRPDSGVIDHIAFGSRGFEAMKQHLARKGVPFRANEVPNSTRRQIFVTDPNNVLIELNFDVAKETAAR